MKILFYIPNIRVEGAQNVMTEIMIYLKNINYDVILLLADVCPNNKLTQRLAENDIKVISLLKKSRFKVFNKIIIYTFIKKNIILEKPDIIHSNMGYCYLWAAALNNKFKIVETIHSEPYRLCTGYKKFLIKQLNKNKLINIVLLSELNLVEFKKIFNIKDNLFVIPNPINDKMYKRVTNSPDMTCPSLIRITFAARFHPIKNHKMLLDALALLLKQNKNIVLQLAGVGELYDSMMQYSDLIGVTDYVKFLGEISDIKNLLVNTDISVISSDSECFPMFLLESMAMGLPVVATNVGGMREIIDGNGILVPKGNAQKFAEAINYLINHPQVRTEYSKRSLVLSKQYNIEKIIKKYCEVYNQSTNEWGK